MAGDLMLPPGFRFHPTDEELVMHYLCRKCASHSIPVPIIAEVDLYKYNPWQLPGMALYGEKEWYFFSPRDRKYPNGSRPNRTAGSGYWKATGADKPIGLPKPEGIKKALVFYAGKAPKGEKTNWIMHEYRLADVDRSARKKSTSLRLDDWVLCRIYNKKGTVEARSPVPDVDYKLAGAQVMELEESKPERLPARGFSSAVGAGAPVSDFTFLDSSDSMPRLHTSDSSCSEHVASPEFRCEREVQSEPRWREWEAALNSIPFNNMDALLGPSSSNPFFAQLEAPQLSPILNASPSFQDLFYLQKPF